MDDLPTIRVIEFKNEYHKKLKDDKGNPLVVDWVCYAPVSALMTTRNWERVSKLRPPEELENDDEGKKMDFMRHRWGMIEPAYEAWKSGQEIPIDGTPLAAWGILDANQIKSFVNQGLRTVEEVAEMTDTMIGKLNIPDARKMPKLAQMFLKNTDKAKAEERMVALEEENAAMREMLEELTAAKKETKPTPKVNKEEA